MAVRTATIIAVVAIVVAAGLGAVIYEVYFAGPPTLNSQNWAGYADGLSTGSANGTITLPPSSSWHGNGEASLWVGMGGASGIGSSEWPFWQAGAVVSCSGGSCMAELFDEGGLQGAPCNGVCAPAWTQSIGVAPGDSISISVYGGSLGAMATLIVDQDGFNTTYNPPPWTPLAGVTTFPSAEWIFESPTVSGERSVMPTLDPPGAVFSSLAGPSSFSALTMVQMNGNPNGQSVSVSSFSNGSFSAYSYDS